LILAVLGIFGGLFFQADQIGRFERLAARDIRARLQGEEAQVRVRATLTDPISGPFGDVHRVRISAEDFSTPGIPLFTEPHLSTRGRIRNLELHLRNFRLGGLRIERLQAHIPECRFDYNLALRRNQMRLSRSGVGTGDVELLQEDLEAFILAKYPEIKRVRVVIADGRAQVSGYGEFIVVATNFEVDAKLEPADGVRLVLTDARITFDGEAADAASREVLLRTLNPVVDLDRDLNLHGAIHLERLILRDGRILASGRTQIPVGR
jgi:hypothetical protein